MIVRYGIMNDIHFPYEHKQKYKLALEILSHAGISKLYLNGDIGEFLGVSKHPIDPRVGGPLCAEVEYMNKRFDELTQMFEDIPVTLIEGNHCYRFFRYIRDVAPQMWGLIDCPLILKFPERSKWKFVPYGPTQLVKCGESNLYLRHAPLGGGQNPAKMTAENALVDIAFGHVHTYQVHTHRKFGPTPLINKAYALGWLGDKSSPVFDYRGSKDRWVEGCTIIECDTETGDYTLEFISLEKFPVLYRGKSYSLAPNLT